MLRILDVHESSSTRDWEDPGFDLVTTSASKGFKDEEILREWRL